MEQVFLSQKSSLIKEYEKCENATKAVVAELNRLYADKIMALMRSHHVNELRLYDDDTVYFTEYDAKYLREQDGEEQRYYTYVRKDGMMGAIVMEYYICHLAIIDDNLMMRVEVWNDDEGEYEEEEEEWRPFSDIDDIRDLVSKETIIRYLEESEEAYKIIKEHPELQAL